LFTSYTGALPAKYLEEMVVLSTETPEVGISMKLFMKSAVYR